MVTNSECLIFTAILATIYYSGWQNKMRKWYPGCSLISEYKDVRYDKDIQKSYLQGRLGGVPGILLPSPIENIDNEK